MSTFLGRFLALVALIAASAPLATVAQPIPVPTPVPTSVPTTSPLPYPAFGPPAPDVQRLVPHSGVPQHVSLTQAIDIAVAISPGFVSERAAYYEIRVKYTAEQQALFPAVSASGSIERNYGTNPNQFGGATPPPNTSLGMTTSETAGFTISQLIFDGGRVIAAIRSAKESDISGRDTLLRELQTLALDVSQNYFAVLEAKANVDADSELVKEFQTSEDAVRAQIRNGVAALSNLAQAEYQTASARGELITAQGQQIAAQAQFATLLGLDADTQIVPQPLTPETNVMTPTYQKSLQQAMLLRPDYLAAQQTVYSDKDALRYAELARAPQITGTYSDSDQRTFPTLPQWEHYQSLGASISIPIYDQGQTWYNIKIAKYTLDEANAALDQTRLQVQSDVRSALAQLISARATLVQDKSGLQSAEVSMQAAQASYRVGVDTILDLVTAEGTLATAQSTYIAAVYAVRTAEQNYYYAVGLGDLHL